MGSYAVIERDNRPETPLGAILLALNPRTPYSLRLHLEGGQEFTMGSIPGYIAEALKQTHDDETGDIFYTLRKISKKEMNPFGAVKRVNVKTNCDNSKCKLNKKYRSKLEVVSCPVDHFEENSESLLILEDDSSIRLKNPRHAIYIAAVYGCDIDINSRNIRNFTYYEAQCGPGPYAALIDLEGAKKKSLFVGFEPQEVLFLSHYDYKSRIHDLDITGPLEDDRLSADEFLHLAVIGGHELGKIEINSIDERGVYAAEAITNKGRVRMIPSNAFLLSRCIDVDAFVDEELVKMQEERQRM